MDIYSILSSKPHNPHYLNRYITFIDQCQQKNDDIEGYVERHHICPKADDMFPEYVCFKTHPWNCAILTARQHFIAHLILWKAFPVFKSQAFAIWNMTNVKSYKINSRIYEQMKTSQSINVSKVMKNFWRNIIPDKKEKHRLNVSAASKNRVSCKDEHGNIIKVSKDEFDRSTNLVGTTKGMTTVKDKDGVFHHVNVDDPRIKTGELVGPNKGKKFDSETREKLSKLRKGKKKSPMSLEARKRLSESRKGRMSKKKKCDCCGNMISLSNFKRHEDKCKEQKDHLA